MSDTDQACPSCNGRGTFNERHSGMSGQYDCLDCGGTGRTAPANPIDAKIAAHLAYLDSNAADCTKLAKMAGPRTKLYELEASVYEEVAAELRNTLGIETP
jgi:hypothetical protein